jgi:hypothetical protein
VQSFFGSWGAELKERVKVIPYELMHTIAPIRRGVYVFADFERLSPGQARLAGALRQRLEDAGLAAVCLNHPQRSLRRFDLQRALQQAGINDYGVHRFSDGPLRIKTPAFVRRGNDHGDHTSQLMNDPAAIVAQAMKLIAEGAPPEDVLAVEFCDVRGSDGLFRKYSVFRIGERLIPRHAIFGSSWMLKTPDILSEALLAEEGRFLDENPHAEAIRRVFDIAGVQYGRIDYGVRQARVQAFEINSHPVIMLPRERYDPRHLKHQIWFRGRALEAFHELLARGAPLSEGDPVRIQLGPADLG